jgi:hypothetical protein
MDTRAMTARMERLCSSVPGLTQEISISSRERNFWTGIVNPRGHVGPWSFGHQRDPSETGKGQFALLQGLTMVTSVVARVTSSRVTTASEWVMPVAAIQQS